MNQTRWWKFVKKLEDKPIVKQKKNTIHLHDCFLSTDMKAFIKNHIPWRKER